MHFDPELYPWLSAGLIAWGLLDCFLGYRIFKATVTLWGIVLGAFAGYPIAAAMGLTPVGQIVGIILGAALGGWLAFMMYLAAVFLAGLFFGLTLGLLLLANYDQNVALVAGLVLGLIGGFVAVKFQRLLIIFSTSLVGAFRALLALMFFTNRTDWNYYLFQQPRQIPALIDSHPWLMPATVLLATAGTLVQLDLKGSAAAKKNRPEAKGKRK